MNNYYVYHLINPITNCVFYVGKGTKNRCYTHSKDTLETARNKRLWGHINNIRKQGYEPIVIKIQENLEENYAYELEEIEIKKYGRVGFEENGILMNIVNGGTNPPTLYGEDNGFYGKQHTEETKRLMSKKAKGRKHSEETKRKMSESRKGVPKSEETKRKIGDKSRGRVTSKETKQKLREYNLREDVLRKNIESKQQEWIVTTPDGVEEDVINLSDYCVEKGLSRSKMYSVASGKRNHHKGFKCRKKNR